MRVMFQKEKCLEEDFLDKLSETNLRMTVGSNPKLTQVYQSLIPVLQEAFR